MGQRSEEEQRRLDRLCERLTARSPRDAEPEAYRRAVRDLVYQGDHDSILAECAEMIALGLWPVIELRTLIAAERALKFWREANGLDSDERFLEELPALFHPYDLRRRSRKRKPPDPLAHWESFPGDPVALEGRTVRHALARLWYAARAGEARSLSILRRFAAAWTFEDEKARRAMQHAKGEIEKARLETVKSLSAYLAAVDHEIPRAARGEAKIRAEFAGLLSDGKIGPWTFPRDPRAVARLFRIGLQDVDAPSLIALGRGRKPARGCIPWDEIAADALEAIYPVTWEPRRLKDAARKRVERDAKTPRTKKP